MEDEALNLADGRRSIGEIRDVLTGRHVPVPLDFVAACFDRRAAAGVVTWKEARSDPQGAAIVPG